MAVLPLSKQAASSKRRPRASFLVILLLFIVADTARCFSLRTRRSTLQSWKGRDDIGWVVETHDPDKQVMFVTIGSSFCNDEIQFKLPYISQVAGSLASSLWPPAFAGAVLLFSPHLRRALAGKSVLELGCGVGLAGLVAATASDDSCVVLTDNDEEAIQKLKDTIDISHNKEVISARQVDARILDWRDHPNEEETAKDIVFGTDVAYYYHLIRPLMDSAKSLLKERSIFLVVGQANRESQWELYHNIKDGCYNQLTDQREPPWEGETRMLLYSLKMEEWRSLDGEVIVEGRVPIAALVHNMGNFEIPQRLTPFDHDATSEDEEAQMMSF